ncbi:BON domain-containing protein [Flavobacterium johnsoniae]|uniref:BON domain-containing protein n=1 Tax=Flavobacterium TaxID=237 RepID=UPI0025B18A15|nr:BON domain-containing protein [Flavobacterium johnsoniae]WJS93342.1 BON domain-containing protein [Flavobacterium johnsoniae]
MKKNNDILRKEVKEALKWEPILHSTEIDVHVNEGAVDLGGTVDTYAQKKEAEHVVKKIPGVRDVFNNVKVDLFTSDIRSDKEITDLVIKTLKENWAVPNHRLTITVKDGWVTLKGILHWNFQRKTTDEAIRY